MKTQCCRETAKLSPSGENSKFQRLWLLWALYDFIFTSSSTAHRMKFSRFLLLLPLELTRYFQSGENLASVALTCLSNPLYSRALPQQRWTPSWEQTARQDPLGEKTALLTWKPSCCWSLGKAVMELLSRWSSHCRYKVLSYLTRNWFLSCSSMLCSLRSLEEGWTGLVNSVAKVCSSSSMMVLSSLAQTQVMGWVGSNLRLLSLLNAVLACAALVQVRQRVPLLTAPSMPTVRLSSPFFYPMFLPARSFSLKSLTNLSCCSVLMLGSPLTTN